LRRFGPARTIDTNTLVVSEILSLLVGVDLSRIPVARAIDGTAESGVLELGAESSTTG
jgi:hypothetical protein